jgi:asparagine synthase (glutamine-hydrolysing)
VSLFTKNEREQLLTPQYSSDALENLVAEQLADLPGRWIDRMWTFEHRTWLPDNILFKQDKTLMAHSVEGREPFCDYRLVEFAARLPVKARLRGATNKVLLRAAAKRIVPDLPVPTRKKQAFMVPLSGAYGSVIREIAGDVLTSKEFRTVGVFNQAIVNKLLMTFPNTSFLVSRQIMALLMFGLWHQALTRRRTPQPISIY